MFATRRGWLAWTIWGALAVLLGQLLPWAPWQFAILLPAYALIAGLLGLPPDTARPARRDR